VTVVRPAALVGDNVDTLVTRHFEAPRLLTVKGCAPRWQFCHVDDLVSALEFTVRGEITGDFAVGCDGWLEQDEVEQISGLKSIELPARLTFGAAQRLHRVGVTPGSATPRRCRSCSTSGRAGTHWPAAGSRARRPRSPRPGPRWP
jgi:hypothetical protein